MRKFVAKLHEPFCGLSHALGAALGLIGIGWLLAQSWGKPMAMLAFSIYGLALIGLYLASALYHSLEVGSETRLLLQKLDHAGIYLLISGTYVPVCLLALNKDLGSILIGLQAVLASIGIILTFRLRKVPSVLNVVFYLVMGWMALAALSDIQKNWPPHATQLLVAGGIIYTLGAVIYALDKPHLVPGKFSAHDLWHLFVLGGSTCHFALMATFVVKLG